MTQPWWETFYDDLLATMLLETHTALELRETVRFLVEKLELSPGARVFDQCCGLGQLAIELAASGFDVVGVDQATRYVERAREAGSVRGIRASFHVDDAFEHVVRPPCSAAYNWWTSYGYADSDEENARMIARAFDSLVPGGRFALDVPNLPGLFHGFLPHVVSRRDTPEGEIILWRESELDLAAGLLRKRWIYFLPDGRRVEHPSALRLQLPSTIREVFERIGFDEVALYGSTRGEPLTLESPRCIVVGRKPR